jgi:hypothetical protein
LTREVNAHRIKLTSEDLRELKFSLELLAVDKTTKPRGLPAASPCKQPPVRDERFGPPYKVLQRVHKQQFGNISAIAAF